MEIYLVGGAVRDRLLGQKIKERDYVVVGATAATLLALGFQKVGRSFPVFLHPDTREQYALARGAAGATTASLHEDLSRRDLTLNALAEDAAGRVIDPFGGMQDLKQRLLRHVSPAFAEDPIRILRVARFMARYAPLGFRVEPATQALMTELVAAGALDHATPERVWRELVQALVEAQPSQFFITLRACGALARLFPELDRLWGIPQLERWHPEIDTGAHVLLVLEMARRLSADPEVLFAALTHDLGKGVTPPEQLPHHCGHEARGVPLVAQLCQRLRAPQRFRRLAQWTAQYHRQIHRATELRPATVLKILYAINAFRCPQRLTQLLLACEADYRGRGGFTERAYPPNRWFHNWLQVAQAVNAQAIATRYATQSHRIRSELTRARLTAVRAHPVTTTH